MRRPDLDIAIVGMSLRFPGADHPDKLWENLRDGVESVKFYSDEELLAAGISRKMIDDPNFVKADGVIPGMDLFDAGLFRMSTREAVLMDPQARFFLECSWEALEDAGCDPGAYGGLIGVYGGVSYQPYVWRNILEGEEDDHFDEHMARFNLSSSLATRVSYKLNLKGPSLCLQTACSTSMSTIHMACQGLLNFDCDMALAGAVSMELQQRGYFYQENLLSPDGHCRAFDKDARGIVEANGIGIVALKRLGDALEDRDHIYATIRGTAMNNDGSRKMNFVAPSVQGQKEVILAALAAADVSPDTVGHLEAHGTATALGDVVEVTALTQAFRGSTDRRGFCALGSIKTNMGHLDNAAGVAGLIKSALALKHKTLPASLHFKEPNPELHLETSPFFVNAETQPWSHGDTPRRAGVSGFGAGGTNVHAVLEEAPARAPSSPGRRFKLLCLSAKTATAREAVTARLADYLDHHPASDLADVAYTLQVGRQPLEYRRMLVCEDRESILKALRDPDRRLFTDEVVEPKDRSIVYLFPGGGAQYVNMGRELYTSEPVFRNSIDRSAELLRSSQGWDLTEVLFEEEEPSDKAEERLRHVEFTLPALFAVELALAELLMSWNLRPQAMMGQSLGEYVAACLAGVFSREDALDLVALRGQLITDLPEGSMLSVRRSEEELQPFLESGKISLAAVTAPDTCLISGPSGAIDQMEERLCQDGAELRRIPVVAAGHSAVVEPILVEFTRFVSGLSLHPPKIPFISNVTGRFIHDEEATDPRYWGRHLRQTVRFAEGMEELLKDPQRVFLEVGPGRTLSTVARRCRAEEDERVILSSMRHPRERESDVAFLLKTVGRLWLAGVKMDWRAFYGEEQRNRLRLPTYPFERRRYWRASFGASKKLPKNLQSAAALPDGTRISIPTWKRSTPPLLPITDKRGAGHWLVFVGTSGPGCEVARRLEEMGGTVQRVVAHSEFAKLGERRYGIDARLPADYEALLDEIASDGRIPAQIVYCWGADIGPLEKGEDTALLSLLYLENSLARREVGETFRLWVVSRQLQEVTGAESLDPARAALLVAGTAFGRGIAGHSLDLPGSADPGEVPSWWVERVLSELLQSGAPEQIAYRGAHRWLKGYEAAEATRLSAVGGEPWSGNPYLVLFDGEGQDDLALAIALALAGASRVILAGRLDLPPKDYWDTGLKRQGTELEILEAEVGEPTKLVGVLAKIRETWGSPKGILHVVGPGDAGSDPRPAELVQHLDRALRGLRALERALQSALPEFCVLLAPDSALVGRREGLGAAALGRLVEAFAQRQRDKAGLRWACLHLDLPVLGGPPKGSPAALSAALRTLLGEAGPSTVLLTPPTVAAVDDGLAEPTKAPVPDRVPNFQNDIEARLASIWQDLLSTEVRSREAAFFDLGGDSLVMVQLISRIRHAFEVEVSVRSIFEHQTVAALARQIANAEPMQRLSQAPGSKQTVSEEISAPSRGEGQLEQLLDELENIPEEELQGLLEKVGGGN